MRQRILDAMLLFFFFSSFDAGGIVDYRFEDGRFRTSASHVTILNLIRLQAVKTGVNA